MGEKATCIGTKRETGEPCKHKAEPGSKFCRYHGGNNKHSAGRPPESVKGLVHSHPGNLHGYRHGAYSARLPDDEMPLFKAILADYSKDIEKPTTADTMGLQRLALFETKLQRAVEVGAPPDACEVLSRLVHQELKALKLTRATKDGGTSLGKTGAEVIQALLARAAAVRDVALEGPPVSGRLLEAPPSDSVVRDGQRSHAATRGAEKRDTDDAETADGAASDESSTLSQVGETAENDDRRRKNVAEHLSSILASRPVAKPRQAKKVAEDDLCDIF